MDRCLTVLALALAAGACVVPQSQAATVFTTALAGSNETPPNASPATGFAVLTLNDAQTQVTFHIQFSGLVGTETAAHLHHAPPGVAGPVVFGLPLGSPKNGVWPVGPTEVAWLTAGEIYVNIHSTSFPGGEIRGNLSASDNDYSAALGGSNEVPPNASPATGTVSLSVNDAGTVGIYHVEYSGLLGTETAAHFHNAPPGSNGPVVLGLPLGSPKDGVWLMSAANLASLLAGSIYLNVHSTLFPGGEIRGNLGPAPTAVDGSAPSSGLTLGQNFPNPFNPSTRIEYALQADGRVTLTIHDLRGRLLRTLVDEVVAAGQRAVTWDGRSDAGEALPSGVYLYRIQGAGEQQTRKLMLTK